MSVFVFNLFNACVLLESVDEHLVYLLSLEARRRQRKPDPLESANK